MSSQGAPTADEIQLNDPQTLYRRWEDSQWSPFDVALSADTAQWSELAEADRGLIFWILSSLMVAEERITTKFSLSTQQVDRGSESDWGALGVDAEEIREFALGGLKRRLDIIGISE